MEVWAIYKMEWIKTLKRKNSMILLIPSILAAIMTFAISTGGLTLSGDGLADGGTLSCMEFVMALWGFFSGLGIWGILLILVAAFQFSGEIAGGQIKMTLLRIGKRGRIVLAKFLALLTLCLGAFGLFSLVVGGSYYLFLTNSSIGNGQFSAPGFELADAMLFILLIFLHLALFMALTFFVGLFLSPFISFIAALVGLFVVNYLIGSGTFSFLKYSALSVSNHLLAGETKHLIPALLSSVLLIALVLGAASQLFKKVDIK
ncbi:hypothetical protein NRIC_25200 [Enterococcus florum]|uniref:Uncharacterized protein n=1 Tax=Enterococcus florum TaxID=2480627 RepID=A0A4V0WPQ0_9ENTE|nr:ABC transporter permease [Enterococcus florum]GCF94629.1 hypothetical protein NRIC_25200 [Enterococcus florum]